MKQHLSIAIVLLLTAASLQADDWPQFRGPTGQGHVTADTDKVPTTFSPDAAKWKVAVPGVGWSSPIVAKGYIYLTTAVKDGKDYSLRALCLQAKDGKKVWDIEVFKE